MKLFVCCSASKDILDKYMDDCTILLNEILKDNDLVFGSCDTGIMGLSYEIAKKYNRSVTGICPEIYSSSFERLNCDVEVTTKDMLDSTIKIMNISDAIIVLPGGFGTLYELFIAIQCKICNEHNLPIIIYNSCGYYDNLLSFIDNMYKDKFASDSSKDKYYIANSVEEVVKYLEGE